MEISDLSRLISTVPVMVCIIGTEGYFKYLNQEWEKNTGFFTEELLSRPLLDIVHPEDRDKTGREIARLLSGNMSATLESRYRCQDGSYKILQWRTTPADNNRLFAIVTDITNQRQAENAHQKNEERLRLIIKGSSDAPWDWDLRTNAVFYSPQWWQQLGYVPDELPADAALWERLIHPEDSEHMQSVFEDALQSGQDSYGDEFRLLHKDGHYVPVLSRGYISRDGDGRPIRVTGTNMDLSARKNAEAAIFEANAILQAAMDQSSAGIAIADAPDGKLRYVNDAGLLIRGGSRQEIVNGVGVDRYVSSWQLLDLDGRPLMTEEVPLARAILFGETSSREFLIRRTATDDRIVRANAAPIKDNTGKTVAGIVVFTDITESKRTEEALKKSREQLAMVVLSSQLGFWDWNIATGEVLRNDRWAEMLGYPLAEIEFTVKSWETLIHVDDRALAWKSIKDHLAGLSPIHSAEYRMRCKDGQWKWISDTAKIVEYGADGQPARMTGVHQDITERKEAEAEREQLLAAIEQSGETMIITDAQGVIQYVNKTFEKETGYSRQEAIGQKPSILKSGRQDEAFYRRLWATISRGEFFTGRIINKRKDGSLFTEFASISPVFDAAGKIINYVAVKRDITRYLEMEAQLHQAQKMESIGQLAGGVAHDYNNALSVILGFTELVMARVDPAGPLYDDLREVYDAAKRSADVTRQLLAFARKQTVRPRVLDLNETVGGMLKMLHRLIGEDIKLSWQPMANLWSVKIDPSQIDQILANLCINARHAINGVGKVAIETANVRFDAAYCSIHSEAVPGDHVLLMVSDDGCGIGKADQEKIFEPFFTTKGIGQGTGLGLATIYGIVKQNNGYIHVYSEPGRGTIFKIYLPRHVEDENTLDSASVKAALPMGQGERVLIVEDETSTLKLAKRILAKLGYTVLAASTTEQALHLAEEHKGKIQLLLTDVIMPKMNGRELADRLRRLSPGLKVLFMSGYTADIITRQGVLVKGMNFIQKPFTSRDLAVKVREELDKKA